MPSSSVDPERLLGLSQALDSLRAVSRNGAEEALDHFPEIGDRPTQNALDGFLEQLADTLRAIETEAGELAGRLRVAAGSMQPEPPGGGPSGPRAEDAAAPRRGMLR